VRIEQLDVPACNLGEGPVWSTREGCLYFVDIASHRLHAYWPNSKRHEAWQFDTFVGSLAECKTGGLLLALHDRLVRFHPERGVAQLEELAVLERDRPLNRLNDGKADPYGRYWVGSMRVEEDAREGRLWCVTPQGAALAVSDGIGVSNSLGFDRARARLYFADSMAGVIERNDFDADGELTAWLPFVKAGEQGLGGNPPAHPGGAPDGSCVDSKGYLWNAEWGGHRICRYTPDGALERVIDMPVSRPSCCTFGGAKFRTLFVTSAHFKMSEEERRSDPNAGALFSIELDDVEGLPADLFGI
jgi:sugar lactone lactonase YvrE